MPNVLALLAPLALLIPGVPGVPEDDDAALLPEPAEEVKPQGRTVPPGWLIIDAGTSIPIQHQVRIERRITVRIAPRSTIERRNLVADLSANTAGEQYVERGSRKCVPVRSIAAVQADRGSRLMLYLRDGSLLAANLEKACRARDFYSGFYIEPNGDGLLCIDRDKLQSRTGMKCEVSGLRPMVPVGS